MTSETQEAHSPDRAGEDARVAGNLRVSAELVRSLTLDAQRLGDAARAVNDWIRGAKMTWGCGDWPGVEAGLLALVRTELVAQANAQPSRPQKVYR